MKLRMRGLHFCYLIDDIIFEFPKYFVIHLVNIERTGNNIIFVFVNYCGICQLLVYIRGICQLL